MPSPYIPDSMQTVLPPVTAAHPGEVARMGLEDGRQAILRMVADTDGSFSLIARITEDDGSTTRLVLAQDMEVMPRAIAGLDGGLTLIWPDSKTEAWGEVRPGVVLRSIAADGTVSDPVFQDQGDLPPRVVALAEGGFARLRADAAADVLHVDLLDAAGKIVSSQVVALGQGVSGLEDDASASIAALEGGGFAVAWTRDLMRAGSPVAHVFSRTYDAEGEPLQEAPLHVSQDKGWAPIFGPRVLALDGGGHMVSWTTDTSGDVYTRYHQTGQIFDAAGLMQGDRIGFGHGQTMALPGGGFAHVSDEDWEGEDGDSGTNIGFIGGPGQGSGYFHLNTVYTGYWNHTDGTPRLALLPDGRVLLLVDSVAPDLIGSGEAPAPAWQTGQIFRPTDPADPLPLLTGNASVGSTRGADLTALGEGTALSFQWLRDGVAISGATGAEYVATAEDAWHRLALRVVWQAADGSQTTLTSPEAPVWNILRRPDGTAGDDLMDGPNLTGGAGNDTLFGSEMGLSELNGGAGQDQLYAMATGNILRGGAGGDHLYGHGTLQGGSGADTLQGSGLLQGDAGDDWLASLQLPGTFHSRLSGGTGRDTLTGWTGQDTLTGEGGDDVLLGMKGDDTLLGGIGQDRLWAGAGHDSLAGQGGHDSLMGEAGRDTLLGGIGNDTLNGGYGSDTLTGGSGADLFQFRNGAGRDVITDFQTGIDRIDIEGVSQLNQLRFLAAEGGTRILWFAELTGGSILVQGVTLADLRDADNFTFLG
ncbi:MAG: calcium-binding protein [Gemmobacter sp.]|nr:calcium-binding protein [Gemmobacter sp.]